MRKIAIILGSESDLSQCDKGFKLLSNSETEVVGVYIRSQHRNTPSLQQVLAELSQMKIDAIIAGAGWANHLTGCCDAYLRYTLRDDKIVVIGVAFADEKNLRHTQAAVLSMTEVPGTQVVYKDSDKVFVGRDGFFRACKMAINELPKIKLPEPKPPIDLSLVEALEKSL
jgi:phosphoribosylcarboxyaminoimidazole (NCAIR) mutase